MRSAKRPLVSIVSVTYNRCGDVLDLLGALRQQDFGPLEVIVVDNASDDGTAGRIRQQFPEVTLIANAYNAGMAAYNTGIQQAQGKYILLVDDDGLPAATDWVSRTVACFEENPSLGAVACQIRLSANQELAPDNPQHLPIQDSLAGYPCPAFVCTGAGVRASAVQAAGYLPEHFFIDYMEFALCMRLWDAGWQVRYFREIEVVHKKTPDAYKRNRAYDYYALRNYLWTVWMLYPWPAVVEETVHHLLHSFRQVLRAGYSTRVWVRALADAVAGYRTVAEHRTPVSEMTLGRYYHLRRHRRPGFFQEARLGRRDQTLLRGLQTVAEAD